MADVTILQTLRDRARGEVIDRDDPQYEDARMVRNAMHDRRPLAILRARDVADVIAGVEVARDHDLDLAIRAGGHGVAGFGTVDDGLVIDLQPMKGIRVDLVHGGPMFFELEHAEELLRTYREWIADAPRSLGAFPAFPDRATAAVHPGGAPRRAIRPAGLLLQRAGRVGRRPAVGLPRRRHTGGRARRRDALPGAQQRLRRRDYHAAIAPLSEPGGYVNFMSDDDQGRVEDNYAGNLPRLVAIKGQSDPDNLFHLNQNIVP